jgi:hypothetical protein
MSALKSALSESNSLRSEFEEAKEGLVSMDRKYREAVQLVEAYDAEAAELKDKQARNETD